ncbi:DUF3558 family protein [Streptomyces sp. 1222.5]|uniref:DUF3558 family protein n=1 Tax=Streptomyces sp. 1222.5 TaxID=1881026 RepID=UPI003D74EBC4
MAPIGTETESGDAHATCGDGGRAPGLRLGLAGCNDDSGRSAGAPRTAAGGGAGSSPARDGSAGGGKTGSPLADVDPCTLLQPKDVPELKHDNFTKARKLDLPGRPTCSGYDYTVEIVDGGADVHDMEFQSSQAEALPAVAGHKAVMSKTPAGSETQCSVALDVTTEEFVRGSVTAGDTPAKVCDNAKKAAGVVAGRLSA